MEELHSAAALDEEIRNDARKKAESILKKADEAENLLSVGINERLLVAEENASQTSKQRVALFEKNNNASIPLEKQRYLITFINNSVITQINKYISNLDETKKFDVIKTLMKRSKSKINGKEVNITVVNFDLDNARRLVEETLGVRVMSATKGDVILLSDDAVEGISVREGILVNTTDNKIKCRFTMDEKINELLDSKISELSTTLFGGRLPE